MDDETTGIALGLEDLYGTPEKTYPKFNQNSYLKNYADLLGDTENRIPQDNIESLDVPDVKTDIFKSWDNLVVGREDTPTSKAYRAKYVAELKALSETDGVGPDEAIAYIATRNKQLKLVDDISARAGQDFLTLKGVKVDPYQILTGEGVKLVPPPGENSSPEDINMWYSSQMGIVKSAAKKKDNLAPFVGVIDSELSGYRDNLLNKKNAQDSTLGDTLTGSFVNGFLRTTLGKDTADYVAPRSDEYKSWWLSSTAESLGNAAGAIADVYALATGAGLVATGAKGIGALAGTALGFSRYHGMTQDSRSEQALRETGNQEIAQGSAQDGVLLESAMDYAVDRLLGFGGGKKLIGKTANLLGVGEGSKVAQKIAAYSASTGKSVERIIGEESYRNVARVAKTFAAGAAVEAVTEPIQGAIADYQLREATGKDVFQPYGLEARGQDALLGGLTGGIVHTVAHSAGPAKQAVLSKWQQFTQKSNLDPDTTLEESYIRDMTKGAGITEPIDNAQAPTQGDPPPPPPPPPDSSILEAITSLAIRPSQRAVSLVESAQALAENRKAEAATLDIAPDQMTSEPIQTPDVQTPDVAPDGVTIPEILQEQYKDNPVQLKIAQFMHSNFEAAGLIEPQQAETPADTTQTDTNPVEAAIPDAAPLDVTPVDQSPTQIDATPEAAKIVEQATAQAAPMTAEEQRAKALADARANNKITRLPPGEAPTETDAPVQNDSSMLSRLGMGGFSNAGFSVERQEDMAGLTGEGTKLSLDARRARYDKGLKKVENRASFVKFRTANNLDINDVRRIAKDPKDPLHPEAIKAYGENGREALVNTWLLDKEKELNPEAEPTGKSSLLETKKAFPSYIAARKKIFNSVTSGEVTGGKTLKEFNNPKVKEAVIEGLRKAVLKDDPNFEQRPDAPELMRILTEGIHDNIQKRSKSQDAKSKELKGYGLSDTLSQFQKATGVESSSEPIDDFTFVIDEENQKRMREGRRPLSDAEVEQRREHTAELAKLGFGSTLYTRGRYKIAALPKAKNFGSTLTGLIYAMRKASPDTKFTTFDAKKVFSGGISDALGAYEQNPDGSGDTISLATSTPIVPKLANFVAAHEIAEKLISEMPGKMVAETSALIKQGIDPESPFHPFVKLFKDIRTLKEATSEEVLADFVADALVRGDMSSPVMQALSQSSPTAIKFFDEFQKSSDEVQQGVLDELSGGFKTSLDILRRRKEGKNPTNFPLTRLISVATNQVQPITNKPFNTGNDTLNKVLDATRFAGQKAWQLFIDPNTGSSRIVKDAIKQGLIDENTATDMTRSQRMMRAGTLPYQGLMAGLIQKMQEIDIIAGEPGFLGTLYALDRTIEEESPVRKAAGELFGRLAPDVAEAYKNHLSKLISSFPELEAIRPDPSLSLVDQVNYLRAQAGLYPEQMTQLARLVAKTPIEGLFRKNGKPYLVPLLGDILAMEALDSSEKANPMGVTPETAAILKQKRLDGLCP